MRDDFHIYFKAQNERPFSTCVITPCEQQVTPELFQKLLGKGQKKGKGGKKKGKKGKQTDQLNKFDDHNSALLFC